MCDHPGITCSSTNHIKWGILSWAHQCGEVADGRGRVHVSNNWDAQCREKERNKEKEGGSLALTSTYELGPTVTAKGNGNYRHSCHTNFLVVAGFKGIVPISCFPSTNATLLPPK